MNERDSINIVQFEDADKEAGVFFTINDESSKAAA